MGEKHWTLERQKQKPDSSSNKDTPEWSESFSEQCIGKGTLGCYMEKWSSSGRISSSL